MTMGSPPIQGQQDPLPPKWQLAGTPSQYKYYMYFVLSRLSIYNMFLYNIYIINQVQLPIAMGMPPTLMAWAALPLKWHMVALLLEWQWSPLLLKRQWATLPLNWQ